MIGAKLAALFLTGAVSSRSGEGDGEGSNFDMNALTLRRLTVAGVEDIADWFISATALGLEFSKLGFA